MAVTDKEFSALAAKVSDIDAVIRGLKFAAIVLGFSGAVIMAGLVWAANKALDAGDTATNAERKAANITQEITTASDAGVSRINAATQQSERRVDAYLSSAMTRAGIVPVGAVVPFFLSPSATAGLAPNWLPAQGQRVEDPASPLNGTILPDLRGRFVLGSQGVIDVFDQAANVGGSATYSLTALPLDDRDFVNEDGNPGVQGAKPRFVIDTYGEERLKANHQHRVQADGVLPPYRRLVYLVRVR
jgi:hypothetical protein